MDAPQKPRLGSAGILVENGKLLMGLSKKWDEWVIPGGGVDYMESFHDTVAREYLEETGLEVVWDRFGDVVEIIDQARNNHRVILYSYVKRTGGSINPGDDIAAVAFFSTAEIAALVAEGKITGIMIDVLTKFGWLDAPTQQSVA